MLKLAGIIFPQDGDLLVGLFDYTNDELIESAKETIQEAISEIGETAASKHTFDFGICHIITRCLVPG